MVAMARGGYLKTVNRSVHVDQPTLWRVDVVLAGEIDHAAVGDLNHALHQVARAAPREIHLDLAGVSFFSSAGITFLRQLAAVAEAHRAQLVGGEAPRCVAHPLALIDHQHLLARTA